MTRDTVGKLTSMLRAMKKKKKNEEKRMGVTYYKEAGCCVDFGGQGRLPGEGDNVSRLEGGGDWSWGCLGRASLAKRQLEQCLEKARRS